MEHSGESNIPVTAAVSAKCFFCGFQRHPRFKCPAKEETCKNCGKKGHFQKVCQSKRKQAGFASAADISLNSTFSAAAPSSLSKAIISLNVCGRPMKALVDTGSSESFISEDKVKDLSIKHFPSQRKISMASTNLSSTTKGHFCIS
ncbi:retrovirus-related pol polyprotein from transposon 17.6 [Plakobranchus ocellatus]|uniref:Retrovirus-related pol polyprotein from transposon 17.6 n=1 Tax=Plakobranchus ocellatus TaxID=259542 RepID=A0AAV4BB30_9GAST|nr:retrovirus-related pol polyprotein from transposon 17.6 [Plakobranchus ocellatus]